MIFYADIDSILIYDFQTNRDFDSANRSPNFNSSKDNDIDGYVILDEVGDDPQVPTTFEPDRSSDISLSDAGKDFQKKLKKCSVRILLF